jgi:hypothetical protein
MNKLIVIGLSTIAMSSTETEGRIIADFRTLLRALKTSGIIWHDRSLDA